MPFISSVRGSYGISRRFGRILTPPAPTIPTGCTYSDNTTEFGGNYSDAPAPLIHLRSVKMCPNGQGQMSGYLRITRINGSNYSDIVRMWICPVANWDGWLCNDGQFLISTTPNGTQTNINITSSSLALTEGAEYILTGVSFRNGANISGYTLFYPLSGVVTIGGIATSINNSLIAAPNADKRTIWTAG